MEARFKVNVPETILHLCSAGELQSVPWEVLMNTQDYQLLSECLKAHNHDLDSVPSRIMKPLKIVDVLGRRFEASPSKNGCVIVRLSDTEPIPVPAAIQSIFSHTRRLIAGLPITEKFVKIQLLESLSPVDSLEDLY